MTSLHYCASCDRGWTSRLAADDCAEQDAYEDDDRKHGRMFRVNRDAGGVFRAYD
jgi:hypothetical protein